MSVQLILGGCGSGKTQTVIGQICEQAAAYPDQSVFVIVPEQATAAMQRALVCAQKSGGILNIDVVSFARLAHRIFEEQGALGRIILDDVGKNLLLRRAMTVCADDLNCLGSSAGRPGTISEIKSIISEFMQYGVDEDDLGDLISELSSSDNSLANKLSDLRRLYGAFRECLGERYLTKEEQLSVLASLVPSSQMLDGSVIALDGFTGLTPVQVELMAQLAKVCERVIVTVTLPEGEKAVYRDAYELFGMSKRFCAQMADIAKESGCELEEPVILTSVDGKKDIISFLETNLFRNRGDVFSGQDEKALELYACANRREECKLAAKKVRQLLQEHGWHYRDIAVVVCDMDSYAEGLTDTMERYGIPCFLDYKHHVMDNAFVEYIRSFLEIEISDYTAGAVMRFLRTGFTEFGSEQIDKLDNVVTARGIRGYSRWNREWDEKEADQVRVSLIDRMADIHRIAGTEQTVTDWTKTLYRFIKRDGALSALRRMTGEFEACGESERAQEYAQVYSGLIRLMDQMTELAGEETVSLNEYARMIDAGLEEVKIGILPESRDHILIGDLTRTRLEDTRAVLILGAGDENLPGDNQRKGLLTRWDRELFADAGLELSPGAKEQTYSQQFYLYQLLSKPTDYLAVTFPRMNVKGDPEEPSYLVREITQITGVESRSGTAYLNEPQGISPRYGADYLFEHLQEQLTGRSVQGGDLWTGIARVFLRDERYSGILKTLRSAASYRHHAARLSDRTAEALYPQSRQRSISQLQKYAECPYKHFLTYGLRLQEREVYEFEVSDFGTVFHAAIEAYGKHVQEEGLRWQEVSPQQKARWIEESVASAVQEEGYDILENEARGAYNLVRIKKLMDRSVDVITRQLSAGDFEPVAYELNFGSGVIDRLDLADIDGELYAKVLDYKTGSQKLDLNREYHGLQIQLPVYMAEALDLLKKETGRDPTAAALFYYTVDDPFVEISPGESAADALRKELRVDGVIRDDPAVLQALDHTLPSASLAAPFGIKKDGGTMKSSHVLSGGDLDTVVAYGRHKAARMNERIAEGKIEVSPYKLDKARGCQYCPYHAICHFDAKMESYRELEKMKDEEALQKMRREIGR